MATHLYTIQNTPLNMDPNSIVNGNSDGRWIIGTQIDHINNRGSYASKSFPGLVVGHTYKLTYTIADTDFESCTLTPYLGDTAGTTVSGDGTYINTFVFSGTNRKLRFYATGFSSVSYYKIEELVTTIVDTPVDISTLENNSWTLSYNPVINQWISFHSYLPNNYLIHPVDFLAKINQSQIKISNSNDYGIFFDDTIKPFIIETIFNEAKINTKVFDSISVIMDTYEGGGVPINDFFSKGIVYTETQCSGLITFNIGNNVTKKEKNWNFNKFQDITNNLTESIFVSDWNDISSSYPIDKVLNVDKLDNTKPWYQRGRMRDKYLAVRFIENNLDNSKFICKFVVNSYRASIR